MRERGATNAVLVCLVLAIAGLTVAYFAWYVPKRRAERRTANERMAVMSLITISSAYADFTANDRDSNGMNDYWTGDIAGLYKYGLIRRELAQADVRPLVPLCPTPIPDNGYYCAVLKPADKPEPADALQQKTNQKSGTVRDPSRFAYCLYPAEPGVSGLYMYIWTSETGRMRSRADRPPPLKWPSDAELRTWAKWD